MYGTYSTNAEPWLQFWSDVARNNGSENDPSQVLSESLMKIITKDDKEKPDAIYGKCVKAWNAYRANESVSRLTINLKKDLPSIAA